MFCTSSLTLTDNQWTDLEEYMVVDLSNLELFTSGMAVFNLTYLLSVVNLLIC